MKKNKEHFYKLTDNVSVCLFTPCDGMNRQERREKLREMKRDPMVKICPHCKNKTLHVAKPTKNYLCDIVCLYCGEIIVKDSNTATPWTYV